MKNLYDDVAIVIIATMVLGLAIKFPHVGTAFGILIAAFTASPLSPL